MAIFFQYETINRLLLAENSTEIFYDLVDMHSIFACQSGPHFLGHLPVRGRKSTSESEFGLQRHDPRSSS